MLVMVLMPPIHSLYAWKADKKKKITDGETEELVCHDHTFLFAQMLMDLCSRPSVIIKVHHLHFQTLQA